MSAVAPFFPSDGADAPDLFLPAHQLNGRQKAAVIVRLLLSQGAELPLAQLPDHHQTALTEQLGSMRTIDRDTVAAVVEEFCMMLDRVGLSFPEGLADALKLLEGKLSVEAATQLKRRAGHSPKSDPWEKVRTFEADRLLPLIAEESTEVAAVVLSKLAVPKAAEILGQLPGDKARRIAFAMSKTGGIEPETVRRIGIALLGQLEIVKVSAFEKSPVDRMGAILNAASASTRDDVLKGLEEEDQVLAEEVKKTIFTFADIPARILTRDVPKILKGVDQELLVKALGGAKDAAAEAAEFMLANMSQRMATALRDEIAATSRFKDKDVEAAQSAVIMAIRELEASGELTFIQSEDEE